MGEKNNTLKARVQLKSDTEENWNKSVLVADGGTKTSGNSFVPLAGELIIYSADNAHPFSRLKVGDGQNNVVMLPFIDANSIQGINSLVNASLISEWTAGAATSATVTDDNILKIVNGRAPTLFRHNVQVIGQQIQQGGS